MGIRPAAVAIASGLLVAFPFAWAIRSSLLPSTEAMQIPPVWLPTELSLAHYRDALQYQPFGRYILNSLLVALAVTVGQVITASTSGYAFARLRFRGRDVIFLAYLGSMMLPAQVTIIPQYLIVADFGWIDHYAGLIVPGLATALSTFLMRQFVLSVPRELEDAGRIDGAGYFRVFFQIVMPLCKPALATVALLAFMGSWTSFLGRS